MNEVTNASQVKKTFFYIQVLTTLGWNEYSGIEVPLDAHGETIDMVEVPIVSRIWEGKRFNTLCDEVMAWKRNQIAELNRLALKVRGLNAADEDFQQTYWMKTESIAMTPETAVTTLRAMTRLQIMFNILYRDLSPYVGMKVAVGDLASIRVETIIGVDLRKVQVERRLSDGRQELLTGEEIDCAYGGYSVMAWTGKGWQANFLDKVQP